jgi:hypothetical protein
MAIEIPGNSGPVALGNVPKSMREEVDASNGRKFLRYSSKQGWFVCTRDSEEGKTHRQFLEKIALRERHAEVESLKAAQLLDFRPRPSIAPVFAELEHQGQTLTFGVRTFSGPDYCEAGLWMGTVGFGLITLSDFRAQGIFNAALVLVGIEDESGERFFENLSDVEALQAEPGAAHLFQQLQGAIFAQNPALTASEEPNDPGAQKARQVARRDPTTRRIVQPFNSPPPTPDDVLSLIRWTAYFSGVVALRCGLLDGWQMQDAATIRQLAQRFPLVALSIERETQLKSTSVITELITRTKPQ